MNIEIPNSNGATIPVKEGGAFLAMWQGNCDGIQPIEKLYSTKFGTMMIIGSEEGVTYITRDQAKAFFGL